MNTLSLDGNEYKENFYGKGSHLLSFLYVTRGFMINESFIRNSDTFLEAVQRYGQVSEDDTDSTKSFIYAYNIAITDTTSIKGMGLLLIQESIDITIQSTLFDSNFFMEHSLDPPETNRCNVLCTSHFIGSRDLINTTVQNHKGLHSETEYLQALGVDTSQLVIPTPAPGILQFCYAIGPLQVEGTYFPLFQLDDSSNEISQVILDTVTIKDIVFSSYFDLSNLIDFPKILKISM